MNTGAIITLVLAILVGLTLGALGGGGSILTLPIFVFIAGIPAQEGVAMSLVVVGGVSLIAAGLHWWRGNFHVKAVLYFSLLGIPASFLGSYLTQLVSQQVLMGIFAALMLAAGIAMLKDNSEESASAKCSPLRCLLLGAAVGGLTGFLGVGGGFMIVPALVLFAGMQTHNAIGASLAIITLNAGAGLAGQLQMTSIQWPLTLGFLGLAMAGMAAGLVLAEKTSAETLKSTFAWFVIVLALAVGGMAASGVAMPSSSG